MCGIVAAPTKYKQYSNEIEYRGPDATKELIINDYTFIFHRLAIMDTSHSGDQPFFNDSFALMCNGEIYNYKELRKKYNNYNYTSNSDSEVLMPLLEAHGMGQVLDILDGEFAFVAYDKKNSSILAARDPMGIRPLFYGYTTNGQICFASEIKALIHMCDKVYTFPPGYYYDGTNFVPYLKLYDIADSKYNNMDDILKNIKDLLVASVIKRLDADVPIGYLLSGGLDSSLVCSIAAKHLKKPIDTFAIGLDYNPIDLKYARQMADYIGSNHTEVIFTKKDIIEVLKHIVWVTETWDITTIRASIPMFLLCKYIRNSTNIRVVLSGEISDELFGYKYTDFAPDSQAFQTESMKRIKELYMYDVLRADRCISSNSLEARVPFSDKDFVSYVMSINPELKLNKYNMGKYLLRKAFDNEGYLPSEILWRDKAAFSDAVGHGLVDCLIELANEKYTDEEFATESKTYLVNTPPSKEALMYRQIFDEYYPNQDHVIDGYWLPNKEWPNCNLSDPSARHLPNYGASGI